MSDSICQLKGLGQWLYDWQTLLSGLLALGAALWAGSLIRSQIAQADQFHRNEVKRSHNAARVALPMALSEVSRYIQQVAENVIAELERYGDGSDLVPREVLAQGGADVEPLPEVDLPKDVIPLFQSFVQTLSSDSDIRHVAELLSSLQILHARYSTLNFNQVAMESTLYGRLVDAAKVGYLNDSLFNYGRYLESGDFAVVNVVAPSDAWDEIHEKAVGFLFSRRNPESILVELSKRFEGYKARSTSPWLEKIDD